MAAQDELGTDLQLGRGSGRKAGLSAHERIMDISFWDADRQQAALRPLGVGAAAAQHIHLTQALLPEAAASWGVWDVQGVWPRHPLVHNCHQPLLLIHARMRASYPATSVLRSEMSSYMILAQQQGRIAYRWHADRHTGQQHMAKEQQERSEGMIWNGERAFSSQQPCNRSKQPLDRKVIRRHML